MNTIRKQGGFTLIELMIVIAILAILLAIAIPAYQDYTIRAKASEAVSVAAGAKVAVSETFQSLGRFPTTTASYGWNFAQSDNVDTVVIGANGVITATSRNTGASTEPAFRFTPNTAGAGRINWECERTAGENRHVPADCRT